MRGSRSLNAAYFLVNLDTLLDAQPPCAFRVKDANKASTAGVGYPETPLAGM